MPSDVTLGMYSTYVNAALPLHSLQQGLHGGDGLGEISCHVHLSHGAHIATVGHTIVGVLVPSGLGGRRGENERQEESSLTRYTRIPQQREVVHTLPTGTKECYLTTRV